MEGPFLLVLYPKNVWDHSHLEWEPEEEETANPHPPGVQKLQVLNSFAAERETPGMGMRNWAGPRLELQLPVALLKAVEKSVKLTAPERAWRTPFYHSYSKYF